MRRLNAIVSAAMLLLFLIHMIEGGMELAGMRKGGDGIFSLVSYALAVLLIIHVLLGIKFTIDTVIAARRSGTFYVKENRLFLARRISGFALFVFLALHMYLFRGMGEGTAFRLRRFDFAAFASQICMVLSLMLHLVTNIKPLRIALGLEDKKNIRMDAAWILAILLFLSGIAFFIYYLRWQVI